MVTYLFTEVGVVGQAAIFYRLSRGSVIWIMNARILPSLAYSGIFNYVIHMPFWSLPERPGFMVTINTLLAATMFSGYYWIGIKFELLQILN